MSEEHKNEDSRVVVGSVEKPTSYLSDKVVKENDRFLQILRDRSRFVTSSFKVEEELSIESSSDEERLDVSDDSNKSETIKEAIREDNYAALLAKKRQQTQMEEQEVSEKDEVPQGEDMKKAVMRPHVSLKFGVVGSGQAGGRIAEVFYQYGYDACAINTAKQDLEYLNLPTDKKLFIGEDSLGGAGRDLEFGYAAVEDNEEEVRSFVESNLEDADVAVLTLSGGGGSGSGSAELLVGYLSDLGLPVVVIYALPGSFDDPQSKHNAIHTLAKLAQYAEKQVINSLVLVDNAKIEMAYPNLPPSQFWKTANNAVVEPLHMFNSVSAMATDYDTLDGMDFAKSLIEAGGCVVFGSNTVPREDYEEDETALLEAMIDNLDNGLLASGFKLEEAQSVGILITADKKVLDSIPNNSLSYVFKYITEEFDSAKSFKGIYGIPSDDEDITIRFIFSGLGLPKERVDSLKNEAKKHMEALEAKRKKTSMGVDLGKDKTKSQADRAMSKVKRKKSGIGKLKSRVNKGPRRR